MTVSMTRRSLTIGLGTLAAAGPIITACGGGGDNNAVESDPSPGSDGSESGLSGSFWYEDKGDLIKVGSGGAGTPTAVATILGASGGVSTWFPRISRQSSRYLQLGHTGATTNVTTALQCFDHASHNPYCFVDMAGFASDVLVSPSGRFISALRSPELLKTIDYAGPNSEVGLVIVDIADVNNIRAVREAYLSGPEAVHSFCWLDGDRFVYVAYDHSIVTGLASAGPQQDRTMGRIDVRGQGFGGFDLHPDGSTMLVKLIQSDSSSDIYLYSSTGEWLDRMTAVDQAYAPQWSPDGRHFAFKWGSSSGCLPVTCSGSGGSTCTGFFSASTSRNLEYSQATQFDGLKVPCRKETYWSAID